MSDTTPEARFPYRCASVHPHGPHDWADQRRLHHCPGKLMPYLERRIIAPELPPLGSPQEFGPPRPAPIADLEGATTAPAPGAETADAAEFAAKWNAATPEWREAFFEGFKMTSRIAVRCVTEDHVGTITETMRELNMARATIAAEAAERTRRMRAERDRVQRERTVVTDAHLRELHEEATANNGRLRRRISDAIREINGGRYLDAADILSAALKAEAHAEAAPPAPPAEIARLLALALDRIVTARDGWKSNRSKVDATFDAIEAARPVLNAAKAATR